jgi:2-methylisocitrate lyase-like PEP mutase family enzyme
VFSPLVAKLAEKIGFHAAYMSGGALSAGNGVPDVGLLTLSEFVAQAQRKLLRRRGLFCGDGGTTGSGFSDVP